MSKDEGIYIHCTRTKGDDMLVYQSTNKDVGFIVTSTELDENVAIMTDHAGVRKLRDYLNEILGEDQDTQPAAGEPKPIGYISETVRQELLNGKHVPANICTATPSRRNPHPGPDANWSVPIFVAPPAAAHGDEAVRKRIQQLEVLLDRCRDHVSESMELMDDYDDAEEDAGIAQELLDDIDAAIRAQVDGGIGDA